jgi:hypothetical protein
VCGFTHLGLEPAMPHSAVTFQRYGGGVDT